jgi:hypothetical protein
VPISEGNAIDKGQSLQFRASISPASKILSVDCWIDNIYSYPKQCSWAFGENTYAGFRSGSIPTTNLHYGPHTFSVIIYTDEGIINTQTFRFRLVGKEQILDCGINC